MSVGLRVLVAAILHLIAYGALTWHLIRVIRRQVKLARRSAQTFAWYLAQDARAVSHAMLFLAASIEVTVIMAVGVQAHNPQANVAMAA